MTDSNRPDDSFSLLVLRYLDDLLEPSELTELERQLASGPAQRRVFRELCWQAEELRCLLEPDQASQAVDLPSLPMVPVNPVPERGYSPHPRRAWLRAWRLWGLGLAASLLVATVSLLFRGHEGAGRHDAIEGSNARSVAEILRARDAAAEDGASIAAGAKLGPGKLGLATGIVELRLATGALMLLEAPVELDLIDSSRAFLHSGKLVVRVPDPSARVEVSTLDIRMQDRGTEFGVSVDGDSGTTLQVFDGAVETVQVAVPENTRLVHSGEAVRILERLTVLDVPFAPNRFIRLFPPWVPGASSRVSNRHRFDTCHIVPAPGLIVIDGDLSDWDRSGEFHSWCKEPFDTTYQARGYLMYDDRCLYIAAQVSDPFPMRSVIDPALDAKVGWQGGGVRLRLCTDPKLGWPVDAYDQLHHPRRPLRPLDVSNRLVHVMMWYYQPAEQPCLQLTFGMTLHSERVNPPGYRGNFRKDADGKGYTLEYAIPWELLGIGPGRDHPKSGDVTAACWTVHWAEADGRVWAGQLVDVLNPKETGWTYMRSATWGKAVWHEKGSLSAGTVEVLESPPFR